MSNEKDPLDFVSFSEEDYQAVEAKLKSNPRGDDLDRRICACGHPIRRHKANPFAKVPGVAEVVSCQPPNVGSVCTCKVPKPVLQVANTKRFLMRPVKDFGSAGHPLLRGIRAVKDKSEEEYRKIEWLISMRCEKCKAEDVKITPVGFYVNTQTYAEGNLAGDITVFLCDSCRFGLETSENPVVDSEDSSDNPEL